MIARLVVLLSIAGALSACTVSFEGFPPPKARERTVAIETAPDGSPFAAYLSSRTVLLLESRDDEGKFSVDTFISSGGAITSDGYILSCATPRVRTLFDGARAVAFRAFAREHPDVGNGPSSSDVGIVATPRVVWTAGNTKASIALIKIDRAFDAWFSLGAPAAPGEVIAGAGFGHVTFFGPRPLDEASLSSATAFGGLAGQRIDGSEVALREHDMPSTLFDNGGPVANDRGELLGVIAGEGFEAQFQRAIESLVGARSTPHHLIEVDRAFIERLIEEDRKRAR